ncbi:glucokinase [Brevibacterium siliguriense]|uniref:Glucokinase n=1 Tax=Brevibacterium siliguriense TaxID=1136497 RepID=A0A1H1Y367_9MICO|nr:ROK family protein [Brevibacterium siliguriense]SDT15833.1 glucokinase [Brevibacterium siliguriense]
MTQPATVAVDVGGTKIRAGSVIDGVLAHVRSAPTPATAGARAVLDTIAEVAAAVIAESSGSRGAESLAESEWRIGIGAAGVIDPETCTVVSATDSLPGWAGTELASELSARTDLPVRAVNDVHAHALGEAVTGASRGARSSLLVAAGTGIGGGFITNGHLLTGRNSAAGHIGHVPSAAAARLDCPCGGTGHVEAIASGPAILNTYQRLVHGDDSPASAPTSAPNSRSGRDGTAPIPANTRELAAAASAGDALAVRAFETGARALGSALGGIVNVLSPEVIVVGGGLAEMDETWWTPLRAAFAAELIPAASGTPLVKAELGQDAALIGAASLWNGEHSQKKETH